MMKTLQLGHLCLQRIALVQLVEHNDNGSWSFVFKNTEEEDADQNEVGVKMFPAKRLDEGQIENFKIAIRFADISGDKKDHWQYALHPYKEFFNNRFSDKHTIKKDTSPILGMAFSYESVVSTGEGTTDYNNKGYGNSYSSLY